MLAYEEGFSKYEIFTDVDDWLLHPTARGWTYLNDVHGSV